MLVCSVSVLQLLWLTISAIEVTTPSKKIAKEGSTIQLICSYNLKPTDGQVGNIIWEHSPLGSTAEASVSITSNIKISLNTLLYLFKSIFRRH